MTLRPSCSRNVLNTCRLKDNGLNSVLSFVLFLSQLKYFVSVISQWHEPDICKTRVFGLSVCEEITLFVLIQYQSVTDRQTDIRRISLFWQYQCIACITCYATVLIKKGLDGRWMG